MNATKLNLIYKGETFRNCVSGAQKSALSADQTFGSTLRSSYGTDFSEAQGIFNGLNGGLESIVAAGPSQTGESPTEVAAKNSQAINNAAASNKNIQAAIGEKADAGGATPGVESGVTQAVRAGAEAQVENNLSNTEAGITEKNYDTGRQNYWSAVKGQEDLPAKVFSPVTSAGEAGNEADQITGKQADANAASSSSWMGLVGGLASSAVKGLTGGIGGSKSSSSVTQQPLDDGTIDY